MSATAAGAGPVAGARAKSTAEAIDGAPGPDPKLRTVKRTSAAASAPAAESASVHLLRRQGRAEFPDSVTQRGAKHLDELADVVASGNRAVMFYLVQRSDADAFSLADDIDPNSANAFMRAREAGVEAICYCCRISPEEIIVDRPIPIIETK